MKEKTEEQLTVLVLGGDGYLGWPTAMHFAKQGHAVAVVDNLQKRRMEEEVGGEPLFLRPTLQRRVKLWNSLNAGHFIALPPGNVIDIAQNGPALIDFVLRFEPDVIIHYAEQPSAPYSMWSRSRAVATVQNNSVGTLNVLFAIRELKRQNDKNAHLIKLGTMGEYGTPNIDIEEGWLEVEHNGRKDRLPFPKLPGSFYHASKVADSAYIEFACRAWGIRATDLNQGVVYGIDTDETVLHPDLVTSFHYDAVFGTALNRFIAQAVVGVPLTVYGKGGQTRGYLNIRDTLQCVALAAQNLPNAGEFRVFNQFTEQFSVLELAEKVKRVGNALGLTVVIDHTQNPRVEKEAHYYNAKNTGLLSLGLEPHLLTDDVIAMMMKKVITAQKSIDRDVIAPKILWRPIEEAPSI